MSFLADWPEWGGRLVWTMATLGIAYGIGHLARMILGARAAHLATGTRLHWDDALVVVTRRIPFWCLLAGAYVALRHWPLSPEDHDTSVKILSALAVASVTFAAAGIAGRLVSLYGPRVSPGVPVSALTQNVVRSVVIVLGVLVIIGSSGYNITPYLTALGVGGLAVALALQDPLSNFFAGVFMSVSGQIRIGDYVKLDSGAEGYVSDFNWRATSIRMLANNIVIVPNAKLAQATVTNYHQPSRDLAFSMDLGVHYQSDLPTVERVTTEVAREVMAEIPGGVTNVEPVVRFHTFSPTSVNFTVTMRGREFADQFRIRHEFVKRLHARYAREGIVIPFTVAPLDPRIASPVDTVKQSG